ncbi:hypothetical protein O9992_26650 [Vibrio lentus]|nr:hypothetical protein [Vibrio lentus]
MAGMAFNNASLGYVHAMAHQNWVVSTTFHTVYVTLSCYHVQRYNAQKFVQSDLRDVQSDGCEC